MRTQILSSRRQAGVTLTELMIALVLGALVVLAATAMVVSSRGAYRTQDETTRLAESARFGMELGNRLVRLAGFTEWGDDTSVPASYAPDPAWQAVKDAYAMNGPNIVGANNSKPGPAAGVNGSDALTIRMFGTSFSDQLNVADGNMLDCAGSAVAQPVAPTSPPTPDFYRTTRAFNVLYVDLDTDGEPSLFCQRQTTDPITGLVTSNTQALIRGVEDFQVLYGEYIPQPAPNNDLDSSLPQSIVYRTGTGGTNPVSVWENVRSVRIAMLIRSNVGARANPEPTTTTYYLFGPNYPAASDPGATFPLASLSLSERTRVRRVVETTVFVRNRETQWSSVNYN